MVASDEGMSITKMAAQLSSKEWMEELRKELSNSQNEGDLQDVSENLFASLRLSTESLTTVARAALWSLSVFPKDFSKEAAEALIIEAQKYNQVCEGLAALKDNLSQLDPSQATSSGAEQASPADSDAASSSSTAPTTNGASSTAGPSSAPHRNTQPLEVLTQSALLERIRGTDGSVQRYTLHPVVRQYAAWELRSKRGRQQEDERGKSEEQSLEEGVKEAFASSVEDAFVAFYMSMVEHGARATDLATWRARFEALLVEQSNVQEAVQLAQSVGHGGEEDSVKMNHRSEKLLPLASFGWNCNNYSSGPTYQLLQLLGRPRLLAACTVMHEVVTLRLQRLEEREAQLREAQTNAAEGEEAPFDPLRVRKREKALKDFADTLVSLVDPFQGLSEQGVKASKRE